MSVPYRNNSGEMIRVNWNEDSLIKLDKINYDIKEYDIAINENKKYSKGMDKLFELKQDNFNLLKDNSLYPAYYLISYDNEKVYSTPVNLIVYGDTVIDENTLMNNIDLQLYNNIIFMIANSKQMTTFNGSRSVWYKIMESYSILSEKDNKILKNILFNKYKYPEEKIEKYCKDLNNYIYYFYEAKINSLMNENNCFECFRFYKSLIKSSIRKSTYSNLNETINSFLLDILYKKIEDMYESGYCYDLFDDRFFASEILDLPDLNKRKKDQVVDYLFDTYKKCIKKRIKEKDYLSAKICYDIVDKNIKYFDFDQIEKLEPLKESIESNYNKDPQVKRNKMISRINNIENIITTITILSIIVGIISFLICLIFSNKVYAIIFLADLVLLFVLFVVELLCEKIKK